MCKLASIIFVSGLVVIANCNILSSENISETVTNGEHDLSDYLQKLEDISSIPIVKDYVTLEKNENVFDEQPRATEDVFEKCLKFLTSRSINIKIPSEGARSLVAESRKRKKIRKFLLPLLLILKLKAAIILPIVLSIIAFVSFKGFGFSLAALAVAGTTALKSLLEHASSKVSYEVVPAPISHWSRSGVADASASANLQYEY